MRKSLAGAAVLAAAVAAVVPAVALAQPGSRPPDTPVQVGLVFPSHPRQDITWTVPGPSHLPSLTYPKFTTTSLWPVFSCAGGFDLNARGGRGEWVLTCVWHPGTP